MTKQELINSLADLSDLPRKDVSNVLDNLAEVAASELADTGEITLPGIGKLKAKERAARTGRNPQTGEAVEVAAKTVVKFSAAKALTDSLN